MRGLQRMVDEDAYCIDILTQISAATPRPTTTKPTNVVQPVRATSGDTRARSASEHREPGYGAHTRGPARCGPSRVMTSAMQNRLTLQSRTRRHLRENRSTTRYSPPRLRNATPPSDRGRSQARHARPDPAGVRRQGPEPADRTSSSQPPSRGELQRALGYFPEPQGTSTFSGGTFYVGVQSLTRMHLIEMIAAPLEHRSQRLDKREVTSDLWCCEALLEGCAPCRGLIPVSSVRT
jgi:hypothetical protein